MGPRSVTGCGTIVRMNRPGFPETVLFEPPTVRGPAPAVAVLVERYGIGFTEIVKRPTAGSAELRPREFREGAARLEALVDRLEPGVVWFQGALAWRAFGRYAGWRVSGEVEWGAQEWRIGDARVFITPNPSPANAALSLRVLVGWFDGKRPAKGVIDVRRGMTLGVSLGPRRRGRDGSAAGLRRRRGIAPSAAR